MTTFHYIIYFYIILNLSHFSSQHVLATIYHKNNKVIDIDSIKQLVQGVSLGQHPYISVIYPIYNEEASVLNTVFQYAQNILEDDNQIEIIFVNDGSSNQDDIITIYNKYFVQNDKTKLIHQINKGKREAQIEGLEHSRGEIIVTVDSDTLIQSKDIYNLVYDIVTNPKVGSTTGNVFVTNRQDNLLTELTAQRYWMANNIERASQSVVGAVLCNCGAFACYRRDVLERCKVDYLNQKFLGNICTYGDDRHLTNLTLSLGYQTTYCTNAIAYTQVPEHLSKFINQQTRWSKSFFREMLWTIKFAKSINFYSVWTMIANPVLSLLLLVSLANVVFLTIDNPFNAIKYLLIICLMSWLRAIFPIIIFKDWKFLIFPLYSFLHLSILLPLKVKALLHISDGKWATRDIVNFTLTNKFKKVAIYLETFCYWLFLAFVVFTIYWFGFRK